MNIISVVRDQSKNSVFFSSLSLFIFGVKAIQLLRVTMERIYKQHG